jgi:outer membrane protein assembly factor BamB
MCYNFVGGMTMKSKRIRSALCAITLMFSIPACAAAQSAQDWPQFLGSPKTPGITAAKTPVNPSDAKLLWSIKHSTTSEYNGMKMESNACGTPIAVGNSLYMTLSSGTLLKLDAQTGKTLASASCKDIPLYNSQIACGDGKIFVPQQTSVGVRISAFDMDSLSPVWQSDTIAYGSSAQQIASPIMYYDHKIYFGTYTQDPKTYAYNSGVYACLSAENGKTAWKHENAAAGYYWNGAAVTGSAIAVSDTAGNVSTYRLSDGSPVSTVSAGGPVNSTPCYANGRIYVSVKSGYIYSVKADANGQIAAGTALKSAVLGNNISSSPVEYNGRLYVAGGGYGAATPFSVLNAADLKTIYQIKEIQSQSSPLVTTAYADAANKNRVLIYVTKYGTVDQNSVFSKDSSCVYVISDREGQTTPSYETLFTPSAPQSCSQSLTCSANGTLFYYNDSGNLYAIGSKAALPAPKTGQNTFVWIAFVIVAGGALVFLLKTKITHKGADRR